MSTNTTPAVTVIMRTKNSEHTVAQALAGLFSQSYQDFELLVVDSGSTDKTLALVSSFPHRLQRIAATDYFPGAVLNGAAEEARGEILVFWNSDVVPLDSGCLASLLGAFDDPEVVAAFARQVPRPEARAWVRRDYASSFPPHEPAPPWITLSLPLAAMRKAAWAQRPFYVDAWASEDTEWGHWAKQQGLKVAYVPTAMVMHSHDYTLRQLYGRRFVEGEADAFIFNSPASPWSHIRGFAVSVVSDWRHAFRSRALAELPMTIPRRAVYHWAHFLGMRHGEQRRRRGVGNARHGQQIVLERHSR